MKQNNLCKSKEAGFSLVELMISVSIFAVVMLLVSGIIVNGLRARKTNSLDITAQTYASSVLEQLKKNWASDTAYKSASISVNAPPKGYVNIPITVNCIDLEGDLIDATTCATEVPPLRRVNVKVYDEDNVLRADLVTEIGTPKP